MKRTEPYLPVAGHSKMQSQESRMSVWDSHMGLGLGWGMGMGMGMGIRIRGHSHSRGIFVSVRMHTR